VRSGELAHRRQARLAVARLQLERRGDLIEQALDGGVVSFASAFFTNGSIAGSAPPRVPSPRRNAHRARRDKLERCERPPSSRRRRLLTVISSDLPAKGADFHTVAASIASSPSR